MDPPLPFMIFHALGLPKEVKEDSWMQYYPPVHGRGRTMLPGDSCVYKDVRVNIGADEKRWESPVCCIHSGVVEFGASVSVRAVSHDGDAFVGLNSDLHVVISAHYIPCSHSENRI